MLSSLSAAFADAFLPEELNSLKWAAFAVLALTAIEYSLIPWLLLYPPRALYVPFYFFLPASLLAVLGMALNIRSLLFPAVAIQTGMTALALVILFATIGILVYAHVKGQQTEEQAKQNAISLLLFLGVVVLNVVGTSTLWELDAAMEIELLKG